MYCRTQFIKRLAKRSLFQQVVLIKSVVFYLCSIHLIVTVLQVSNAAHCIKVASDFLSVEAISTCEMLAGEFRQENLRDPWKDDVLQLNYQLYCAWLSLQRALEESRTPFASTFHCSQPSTSCNVGEAASPGPSEQKRKHGPQGDKSGRKKPRYEGSVDPRPRFRCNLCPAHFTKTFLDHGLRNHLWVY
jgi:hypothetical protein